MTRLIATLALILSTSNWANANSGEALSFATDASNRAMVELIADPPLPLLANKKGQHKWSIQPGYATVKTNPDDNTIVRLDGTTHTEISDFKGIGLSAGYSYSWADRWAFIGWLQYMNTSGSHISTPISDTTKAVSEITSAATDFISVTPAVSYEFFASNEKFSMPLILGPSIMFMTSSATVANFNGVGGALVSRGDVEFSATMIGLLAGTLFVFNTFENWRITPYIFYLYGPDACQEYQAAGVQVHDTTANFTFLGSHPDCEFSNDPHNGETLVNTQFLSLGFKVQYKPWRLNFGVSSSLRNLVIGETNNPSDVKLVSTIFTLSKAWGDYDK